MARTDREQRDALVERLFESTVGALELLSLHLGWRLGLYQALAGSGPLDPPGLAETAGIAPRYAREWLEQQAVGGFLEVDNVAAPPDERRYSLPAAHAEVLTDPESPVHVAPFAPMVVGIAGALPEVVEAYRTGGGVPFARYGPDLRDGQGAINRPAFAGELAGWLAGIGPVHARLSAEPPARVADVGCGQGFSTVALARAYPNVRVDGFDLDPASVADAEGHAAASGVGERVSFVIGDAADVATCGPYDLVWIFEALHDMARPVEALDAARRALADGGSVVVGDERVAPSFVAPGDPVERMMYGWSVLHCLPAALAEQPSTALGTVLRAETVERLAREAGFGTTEVLPIENDFIRFYRLAP